MPTARGLRQRQRIREAARKDDIARSIEQSVARTEGDVSHIFDGNLCLICRDQDAEHTTVTEHVRAVVNNWFRP